MFIETTPESAAVDPETDGTFDPAVLSGLLVGRPLGEA